MIEFFEEWRGVIVVSSLAFFWIWESLGFFFPPGDRWMHAGRNVIIALVNALILSVVFAGATVLIAEWTASSNLGFLRWGGLTGLPLLFCAFVILDVWTYWWHRLNHKVPILWRFHRMHHSDPNVDVTTATRFHFGEIILSSAIRLFLIPFMGIPIEAILFFDGIQLPIICLHHANISLPYPLDRVIRFVLVTPFMHKVHHSRRISETDSNYSSVLSLWDRLFGSYVEKDDYTKIRFGLDGYDDESRQSLIGLFRTPLFQTEERKKAGVDK